MAKIDISLLKPYKFLFCAGKDAGNKFDLYEVVGVKRDDSKNARLFYKEYNHEDKEFYDEEIGAKDFLKQLSFYEKVKSLTRNEAMALLKIKEQIDRQKGASDDRD